MDIVRLVEKKVLHTVEIFLKAIEKGIDFPTLEKELKKELDALGCGLLQELLTAMDEKIYQEKDRKRHWKVVRRRDKKAILTPFGQLTYKRTYYQNKQTKEYAHLVDKKVGITPHMRVGSTVKGELIQTASQVSYEKATCQVSQFNPDLKVSRQTVAASVKQFKAKELEPPKEKRKVKAIYIEADEDHIALKGKKGGQARLIYIHEGYEGKKRRHLKNVRHFTTVTKSSEQFWLEVCDYIADHYDPASVEEIYLSGDGGKWIRVGQYYVPGVTFILDKFHLAQRLLTATAHAPTLRKEIYKNIRAVNKQGTLESLTEALSLAKEKPRQKRIQDTINYIMNNWDGIEAAVKHPHVGCSAEGHVSHVLAARMSSRPMAWSIEGAEKMACIRAVLANGESASEHFLASHGGQSVIMNELKIEAKQAIKALKAKKHVGRENICNVPVFRSISNITRALKDLNSKTVI